MTDNKRNAGHTGEYWIEKFRSNHWEEIDEEKVEGDITLFKRANRVWRKDYNGRTLWHAFHLMGGKAMEISSENAIAVLLKKRRVIADFIGRIPNEREVRAYSIAWRKAEKGYELKIQGGSGEYSSDGVHEEFKKNGCPGFDIDLYEKVLKDTPNLKDLRDFMEKFPRSSFRLMEINQMRKVLGEKEKIESLGKQNIGMDEIRQSETLRNWVSGQADKDGQFTLI